MLIKNVLSSEKANELENVIMGSDFPWYWNESTLVNYDNTFKDLRNYQFTHNFYVNGKINSNYCYLIDPIIESIEKNTDVKIKRIFRAKANLLTQVNLTEEEIEAETHTDILIDKYYSFVYYVCDSDGETVLYDDDVIEKATPEKNTGIFFKSSINHRGTNPSVNKRRVVINLVLETY
jgi:hypothetical protein